MEGEATRAIVTTAFLLLTTTGLGVAVEAPNDRAASRAEPTVNSATDTAVRWLGDSWVTMQVEPRGLTNREVDVTRVRMKTHDGMVTLDGTVETGAAHLAAQEDAQRIEGVTTVINHLQVGSEAARHPQGSCGAPWSGSL